MNFLKNIKFYFGWNVAAGLFSIHQNIWHEQPLNLRRLVHARAVRERVVERKTIEPKCVSCTATCCRVYENVNIHQQDVDRLMKSSFVKDTSFIKPFANKLFTGHIGTLKRVKQTAPGKMGDDLQCIFLSDQGWCNVWEHRPDVCRNYTWWTCTKYEKSKNKNTDGKVRLPVVSC